MVVLIGEKITRFWIGDKYVFKRISRGEWECVYQDHPLIPPSLIADLGD